MTELAPNIYFTNSVKDDLSKIVSALDADQIAVLVDENTEAHCLTKIGLEDFKVINIQSGEANKNLQTLEQVWTVLTKHNFTRKSVLINLGGGVIGDLGGFAASTFKRGIRFINVPTTLLAMVDASVGGKLGVDFHGLKNHIGLFRQPDSILIDPVFLETLDDRQLKAGFAEVVKHALIADSQHWQTLSSKGFDKVDWSTIIPKSVQLKYGIVEEDPEESGLRKILNFGHTLGHAIESHFLNSGNSLLHGEAVALGVLLESHLSMQKGWLSDADFRSIANFIATTFSLPSQLPTLDSLSGYLSQDKKNDSGGISFSLVREIGKCEYDVRISDDMINQSLYAYSERLYE